MFAEEPVGEPFAGAGAEVEGEGGDAGGAGGGDLAEEGVQVFLGVGEGGQDRGDEDAAREACVADPADEVEAGLGAGGAGFEGVLEVAVQQGEGDADADRDGLGGLGEQGEVAGEDGALGEDGERGARVGEGLDDAGHEAVAALGALVRVGVGAHGDVLALPAGGAELPGEDLDGVDLHDDLAVEVVARVQVEVGVAVAGEAVVADDAVGDEVAGAGGDVEQRPVLAERLDRDDADRGLQVGAGDRAGAAAGGIGGVAEAQGLGGAAAQPGDAVLDRAVEVEALEAEHNGVHDRVVRADAQDTVLAAARRVEHAREEALRPVVARRDRPLDAVAVGLRVPLGAVERLRLGGQTAAHDAPQVAVAVVRGLLRARREPADADQPVADGQPGALAATRGNVLPAVRAEEPVVAAGDQLGAVLQHDPVGELHGPPVREDRGPDVPAVLRAAHLVADLDVHERLGAAVGEQDRRVARQAVGAPVGAAAVRVDRPLERHRGRTGHLVEDGLGVHLVEHHVGELGSSYAAHDPRQPR